MESHQFTKGKAHIKKLTAQFQLIGQLKHYGLNPKDWTFQSLNWSEKTGMAEVSHRKDPNLRIKGRIEKSGLRAGTLQLWKWSDLAWDL